MFKIFIERPVFSTVISILIVLLGLLALKTIPMTQYPVVAPPTVVVSTSLPGANAETMIQSVITPLEEQINGVEGMTYMTSSASNNGSASITVFFESGYDPDIAAVNVQNRVSLATPKLPAEVKNMGVATKKTEASALMYVSVYSDNPEFDETFIQNYTAINIRPELLRVNGVGQVNIFGVKDYTLRIWIDPDRMANYGVTVDDVRAAIAEQSREASAGTLGQNAGHSFEYVIKYKGRYNKVSQFENIILRRLDNGKLLKLNDVAKIELDAFSYSGQARTDGKASVTFGVFQTPGSNAHDIAEKVYTKFDDLRKTMPEGLHFAYNLNSDKFLMASVDKVQHTIIEAFILVFFVVFIFLQDFKSTLIPAIAVPVAIIGTFFFMEMVGFSINLLTLFALILAIGIVVDDAIVVVEAVHSKLERGAKNAKEATVEAMNEIGVPIISITLVMAAVFVPVTFATGPVGVFYKQFAITLIIAILISAVNALTLSPALCALFLKPSHGDGAEKKGFMNRFYDAFNVAFNLMVARYIKSVGRLLRHRWIAGGLVLVAIGVIFLINKNMPTGFVPDEDQGTIFVNVELPEGASLDRTVAAATQLEDIVNKEEGVQHFTCIKGRSFFAGQGSSYAMGFIRLKDWSERERPDLSSKAILGKLFGKVQGIADARIIFFLPGSVPGFGASNGVEAQIVDTRTGALKSLGNTAQEFSGELMKRSEFAFVNSSFNTNFPQYDMHIDVPKIKEANLTVSKIMAAMQGYIGGLYAADFNKYGKQYKVFIQAKPEDRADVSSLNNMFVRNADGKMAPLSEFVTLTRTTGAQTVSRFNMMNAVTLRGTTVDGVSTGQAIKALQETAAHYLPAGYAIKYSGLTREEILAGGQMSFIFLLSVLFVFLFLAIQYESYILPFAVIFSLPLGVAGAYFVSWSRGLENNIYFQVALIMLLGLLAKNAILIIEFALQCRKRGMSLPEAAIEGAKTRIRPVMMTSFAFILGLLPLVLASGVAAAGNRSIGTGAAGGMLIGTVLGLFIIPVLFVIFQWLHEKITGQNYDQKASSNAARKRI